MKEVTRILTLLIICKICSCQFFYNYERDEPTYPQSSSESVDPSQYQYVPPSAVDERYSRQIQSQPVLQNTETVRHRLRPREQVGVADNQYYQQPSIQPEYVQPEILPQQNEEVSNIRRTVRRRKLVRSGNTSNRNINQVEMQQPPKHFGPSVFQNIGLGEAPAGIHIPQDSLLNILRGNNPVIQSNQPRHIQQTSPVQYTPSQTTAVQPYLQNTETISSRPRSRQQIQVVETPQYVPPEVFQPQEVRSIRRNNQHNQRPSSEYSSSRNVNQVQMRQPPKYYGPSVFENIGLGEAPSGVHVPEDSLLNLLRGNSPVIYSNQPRHVQQAPPVQYSAPQTTAVQPYIPQNHFQPVLQNTETISRRPRSRQQVEVVETPSEDHYYEQQSPQPQYLQPDVSQTQEVRNIRRNKQRSRSGNSSSRNVNQVQMQQPPKQYGPSVFENIGLGEAPSGVHVPEDSLLNILRSNNHGHSAQPRHIQQAPSVQYASPRQHSSIQNPQYAAVQQPQTLNYDNQRVNNERTTARQSHAQPLAPVQQLDHDIPSNHHTNAQHGPQQGILRNTQRRTQQPQRRVSVPRQQLRQDEISQRRSPPPPQTVYEAPEQPPSRTSAPRPQRRREEIAQRTVSPPTQTVYDLPEQQNDDNYNNDYEDDIIRHKPPNADHRRRQQVIPPQNQQYANDHHAAPRQPSAFKTANLAIAALPDDVDGDGIPGQARSDYPTLHVIPPTSFSCAEQPYNGYYADLETACQVVHMCQAGGVQSSYLCPNGTIFSQEKFSCQWWYKVNCADSPKFYSKNDSLYKVPPPPPKKKKN